MREVGRIGVQSDISFLESLQDVMPQVRNAEQEKASIDLREHPAKWRHRDVVVILGSMPGHITDPTELAHSLRESLGARTIRLVSLFGAEKQESTSAASIDAASSKGTKSRTKSSASSFVRDDDDVEPICLFPHFKLPKQRPSVAHEELELEILNWTWRAHLCLTSIATQQDQEIAGALTSHTKGADHNYHKADFSKVIFSEAELQTASRSLAAKVTQRIADKKKSGEIAVLNAKRPVLVCVLRAGFFVHADVLRIVLFEEKKMLEPDWVRVSTYNKQSITAGIEGSHSAFLMDLQTNVAGRDVILLDDSVGRGRSMRLLCELLGKRGVSSITCAALLTPRAEDMRLIGNTAALQNKNTVLLGYPTPELPLYAHALPEDLGADPFSKIGGYGNDAVTKYRLLPFIGVLHEHKRDAIWAEDTLFGGIDYRMFAHPQSPEFLQLHDIQRKTMAKHSTSKL
ncbi:unnamed protein product [Amoebophrya sp. A120]|nr:unnamed protein product [Amoebophrya sp. A120]|eukprot:GSA120T00005058001.1